MSLIDQFNELQKLFVYKNTVVGNESIFDALRVDENENRHSDIIAWLLSETGPFLDNWFLKELLKKINFGDMQPNSVEVTRENSSDQGRVDIKIEIDPFLIILIENKINSKELENQCKRYLNDHGITEGSLNGRLIYLTRSREWPKSIDKGDERVVNMSYAELAEILSNAKSENFRDKAEYSATIVKQYINLINNVMGLPMKETEKPLIQEPTPSYIKNIKKIEQIRKKAAYDSKIFIQWLIVELNRRFFEKKWIIENAEFAGVNFYRKENWESNNVTFGVSYSFESKLKKTRLITEYSHRIGIRVQRKKCSREIQKMESQELRNFIRLNFYKELKVITGDKESSLKDGNAYWPFHFIESFNVEKDSFELWGDRIISKMMSLSKISERIFDEYKNKKKTD